MSAKVNHAFLRTFDYPLYAIEAVGRDSVVVAGGGGAAKTGVPNQIDVVSVKHHEKGGSPITEITASLDTDAEAVMSLSVSNMGGAGSFVLSLEGHTCVEYSVVPKTGSLGVADITTQSTVSNSNHSQQKDAHPGRVIRTRKVSTKNRKLSDDVITGNLTASNECEDAGQPVQFEITKLRQFTTPKLNLIGPPNPSDTPDSPSCLSEAPTCVTSGGPANFWFAVGSDSGSVYLFDRARLVKEMSESEVASSNDTMLPFLVYSDVSGGLNTGVCALTLTTTQPFPAPGSSASSQDTPLLATICEQPSWNSLYLWSVYNNRTLHRASQVCEDSSGVTYDKQRHGSISKHKSFGQPVKVTTLHFSSDARLDDKVSDITQPYALATYSRISTAEARPPLPKLAKREFAAERSNYRFKHCQFLNSHLDPLSTYEINNGRVDNAFVSSYLLVTTMQPLCANRKSFGWVVVWRVPIPSESDFQSQAGRPNAEKSYSPLTLVPLTDAALPPGELPACLAVHSGRTRALVGVGTMEGRVEVYFLSPRTYTLSCVYSVKDAHPIFVTALAFLPICESHSASPKLTVTGKPSPTKRDRSPINRSEYSYELVSVSVDRKLCWHCGPRWSQINRLAHGLSPDPVGLWARGQHFLQQLLIYYGLIFLFPVLLSLFDRIFYGLF